MSEADSEVRSLQTRLDEANLRCKKLEDSSAQSKRDQKKHVSTLMKKIAEMEVKINVLKESPSINRQMTDEDRTVIQQNRNLETVVALQQQEIDRLSQYLQRTEEQLVLKESELATMSERLAELSAKEDISKRLLAEIKSLEEELRKKEEACHAQPGDDAVGTKEARHCKKLYQQNQETDSRKPQLDRVQNEVKTLQNALRQRNCQNEELKESLAKSSSILRHKEAESEWRSRLEAGMRLSEFTVQYQLAVSEKQRERLESLVLVQSKQLLSHNSASIQLNQLVAKLRQDLTSLCAELTKTQHSVTTKDAEIAALRTAPPPSQTIKNTK